MDPFKTQNGQTCLAQEKMFIITQSFETLNLGVGEEGESETYGLQGNNNPLNGSTSKKIMMR